MLKSNLYPGLSHVFRPLYIIVGYLTPDSDLDLAPDPDQFGALPPIRYINL